MCDGAGHGRLFFFSCPHRASFLPSLLYSLYPPSAPLYTQPLYHPLTFESLGDALRLFEGQGLRNLAYFSLRNMRDFTSNLRTFFKSLEGSSKIWADCPTEAVWKDLPYWVRDCHWLSLSEFRLAEDNSLTKTIPTDAQLCGKYLKALRRHVIERDCNSCLSVLSLTEELCHRDFAERGPQDDLSMALCQGTAERRQRLHAHEVARREIAWSDNTRGCVRSPNHHPRKRTCISEITSWRS